MKVLATAMALLLAIVVMPRAAAHICFNSSTCGECSDGNIHYHAPSSPTTYHCFSIPDSVIESVGDSTVEDAFSAITSGSAGTSVTP